MRQSYALLLLIVGAGLGIVLTGALRAEGEAAAGRYQIASMGYGLVARLDTRTGQVVVCDRNPGTRMFFACGLPLEDQ